MAMSADEVSALRCYIKIHKDMKRTINSPSTKYQFGQKAKSTSDKCKSGLSIQTLQRTFLILTPKLDLLILMGVGVI